MASDRAESRAPDAANPLLFWGVALVVVAVDLVTKATAVWALQPEYTPHDIVGDAVRLTLVHNPGAAFGLSFGPLSRWIFMALTVAILGILWRFYRATRPAEHVRVLALALVCGGAVGNLLDRIRSGAGVVDFIDVGWGDHRWPTFNVADMAVSIGAVLLAWVLLQEDRVDTRVHAPAED